MSTEPDLIVIDDDDDEDDNVEIINTVGYEASCLVEVVENSGNKEAGQKAAKKQVWPKQIQGYTKPSLSYPIMIAHALASSPNHQATAINICNIITEKHPYFKVCPLNWQQSVYSALTRRKKCFVIVDTNQEGEYVWSYNPLFEKYMLENWVPKYIQGTALQNRSSGSEVYGAQSNIVVSQAELNMEDPGLFLDTGAAYSENNELLTRNTSQNAEIWVQESVSYTKEDLPSDFLPGNACHIRISLSSDEAGYRLEFQAEHPKVEKFRLHCTVCDIHLGTAGKTAETNVRFHSRLGVLTCVPCYSKTINLKKAKCVCSWCNSSDRPEGYVNCWSDQCSAKFCVVCVRRNFGETWLSRILQRTDWKCFLCDMKQIWPHRAIAYSLYIHYTDLRKMKHRLYGLPKEKQDESFYMKDKATCCKISIETILNNVRSASDDGLSKATDRSIPPKAPLFSSYIPTSSNMSVSTPNSKPTNSCFPLRAQPLSSRVPKGSNMPVSTQNSKPTNSSFPQRVPLLSSNVATNSNMFVSTRHSIPTDSCFSLTAPLLSSCVPTSSKMSGSTENSKSTDSISPPRASILSPDVASNPTSLGSTPKSKSTVRRFPAIAPKPSYVATNSNMFSPTQNSNSSQNYFPSEAPLLLSNVATNPNQFVSTQNSSSTNSSFPPRDLFHSSNVATNPNMFVPTQNSSQQQTLVIKERSPNHFFVQSSERGPHVTVNTGTQYIHNIYPESNFTVVQPSTIHGSLPSSHTLHQVPLPQQIFVDTLAQNQSSSQQNPYNSQCPEDITTELIVVENSLDSFPEDNCSHDPFDPLPDSTFKSKNTSSPSDNCKEDSTISQNSSSHKNLPSATATTCINTERNKIKMKPMPKSKKRSLLQSILQRQQLESMEKNVRNDFVSSFGPDKIDARVNNQSGLTLDLNLKNEPIQQIECVDIKSELSTSQLLTFSHSAGNDLELAFEPKTNEPLINRPEHVSTQNDEQINNQSPNFYVQNSVTTNIPKIKVRTLEELQDHRNSPLRKSPTQENLVIDHRNSPLRKSPTQENLVVEKEQDQGKVVSEITQVDVTSLKQGIIEASRTLVTTQKRFKELARTISSQVLYETKPAKKLIKKFQEILKLCKRQIEDVDSNVSNQYHNLFDNMDLGLLLKSIERENEENVKKQTKLNKYNVDKQHKHSYVRTAMGFEPTVEEENSNRENFEETSLQPSKLLKRKRGLVDINPLGKKTILGTPNVTQEDVDEINNHNLPVMSGTYEGFMTQLKSKQLELRKKKKKEDPAYKKRTKWYKKKYNHTTKKPGGRRRKREEFDDYDDEYPSSYYYKARVSPGIKCRTRVKPPSVPLRISQRNHPSTACLGLSSSSNPPDYPSIKPCSVLLHRLDPRIVQLQEMRFLELVHSLASKHFYQNASPKPIQNTLT